MLNYIPYNPLSCVQFSFHLTFHYSTLKSQISVKIFPMTL